MDFLYQSNFSPLHLFSKIFWQIILFRFTYFFNKITAQKSWKQKQLAIVYSFQPQITVWIDMTLSNGVRLVELHYEVNIESCSIIVFVQSFERGTALHNASFEAESCWQSLAPAGIFRGEARYSKGGLGRGWPRGGFRGAYALGICICWVFELRSPEHGTLANLWKSD